MQNDIEQRTVDLQAAIVVNKAQFPEPVHEVTDSRTGRPHHLCQSLLAHLGDHGFGSAFLAEMSEQEQNAGQSLFTRVEELSTKSSS